MTKSDISHQFRTLTKAGLMVFTFNSNTRMRGACQGFVDHFIVDYRRFILWFLEVKLGNDRPSTIQLMLGSALRAVEALTRCVRYRVVSEKNFDVVFDEIAEGK